MRIVVNADDFGCSTDTVRATIDCFEGGLLTSASLMTGMPATTAAFEFARTHPEFSYGVHLQFVGDGAEGPVSDPGQVPGLVDSEGRFLPTNVMRARALLRRVPVAEIEQETVAQLELVQRNGIPIAHVDSHRHLHKFAPFRMALTRALPRFGIKRVRNVQDIYASRPLTSPTYWAGPVWRRALMRSFVTTDHFYMPTSAHDQDWHTLASRLPDGRTLEIGVHPGYEDGWRDTERLSLEPFVYQVRESGHELVPWSAV